MLSATAILGVVTSLWGSGALLGWLIRLGIAPAIPFISGAAMFALEMFSGLMRWLGTALADCFEKPSRLVIMLLCFLAGAWHFAGWRPWHGMPKSYAKAAISRTVEKAPAAPKVAQKAAKRDNDARSIFNRSFIPD